MTQQGLSAASGISRATIAQLESGTSDPRLSTLVYLARALDVPLLLFLVGLPEARALAMLPGRMESTSLAVPPADQRRMERLVASGMLKDRLRAARLGATVTRQSEVASPCAAASAAIFSGILPGSGTVIGALLGELLEGTARP